MHEVEADFGGQGGWTNLTPDLLVNPGVTMGYGISGTGPLDLVASTGSLGFALDNSEHNSVGVLGYYSPGHANARAGFGLGIGIRYTFRATPTSTPIMKLIGRLKGIEPQAGKWGDRKVLCLATDWIDDLANARLNLPTQINKRADQVLAAVVAAVPRQPLGTSFDVADSTFPYALDSSSRATSGLTEAQRVCQSEFGRAYLRRGILRFEKKTARLAPLSTMTFDGTMQALGVKFDVGKIRNRARITIHPRIVDAAATTVLFSKPSQSNPAIDPGQTIAMAGRYNDPANRAAKVGGTDMVAPAAATDYLMNAAVDGSGADLTANCSVVVVYGANQADYAIENVGGTKGYLTKLQARGRGIYDYDPVDVGAADQESIDLIGELIAALDMPYQTDVNAAEAIAAFLVSTWGAEGVGEAELSFLPRDVNELTSAMALEPGDVISVVEQATGINSTFYIQRVAISIDAGGLKTSFTWSLQRALSQNYWILGVTGYSELGITTVMGPL